MPDPYLYEVLYRGQPDGTGAYHVVVAADGVDAFNDPTHSEKIYTMEQAEAAGYALPALLGSINTATQKNLDATIAQRDALTATVQSLTTDRDTLQANLNEAQQQIAGLQADKDNLQGKLTAAQQAPATEAVSPA